MHVFSAFGFVHKITTFEKTAGFQALILFQALIQFSDAETASSAKEALDGRGIPRDYTNHLLPVSPSATDTNGQFSLGLDGKKLEPESNVLLASIERMQYAVTLETLQMVFATFGPVLKIAMFDPVSCNLKQWAVQVHIRTMVLNMLRHIQVYLPDHLNPREVGTQLPQQSIHQCICTISFFVGIDVMKNIIE